MESIEAANDQRFIHRVASVTPPPKRVLIAVAIAVLGLVAAFGEMASAGSRGFVFEGFRNGKESSRVRVTMAGTHRITIERCRNDVRPAASIRYKIVLQKDEDLQPDPDFGERPYRCSLSRQSRRWGGVEGGDIYFQFNLDSYSEITGRGRHFFPG